MIDCIFRMIESLFDVHDEQMLAFIMNEQKEDIESRVIRLIKRLLDDYEYLLESAVLSAGSALQKNVTSPDQYSVEYRVLSSQLPAFSDQLLDQYERDINILKTEIDTIERTIIEQQKHMAA